MDFYAEIPSQKVLGMDGFADVVERISRQKAGIVADEEQATFVGEESDLVHVSA